MDASQELRIYQGAGLRPAPEVCSESSSVSADIRPNTPRKCRLDKRISPAEDVPVGSRKCRKLMCDPFTGTGCDGELGEALRKAQAESRAVEFVHGQEVLPRNAPVDAWLVKSMQSEEAPVIAEMIQKAALENREDPFGLAREAGRVMAAQVGNDISNLEKSKHLGEEDRGVLVRLKEALQEYSDKECIYSKWIELTVRYTRITGAAFYKTAADKYDLIDPACIVPDKLAEVENYSWRSISESLIDPDYDYEGENRSLQEHKRRRHIYSEQESVFKTLEPVFLGELREGKVLPLPTFQVLGIKDLNYIQSMPVRYGGVILSEGCNADGDMYGRGDFFLHDLDHIRIGIRKERRVLSPVLRHRLTSLFYKYQREIDAFGPAGEGSLFKAMELIVFVTGHEMGLQIEDAIFLHSTSSWSVSQEIVGSFYEGKYEDLRSEYGHCVKKEMTGDTESETLKLAETMMARVRSGLQKQGIDKITAENYEKALREAFYIY